MTVLAEVIPDAESLSRTDKLRLIQLLADDLASDWPAGVPSGRSHAVWSPDRGFEAADVMLNALAAEGRT